MSAEYFLAVFLPWLITIALIITILVSLLILPQLIFSFFKLPKRVTLLLAAFILAGVLVRYFWTPFTHRIYYDEDRYLTYSVTFARFGEAKSILTATSKKLIEGFPDQTVRLTVPIINAWNFKLFGYNEYNLFVAAKLISSLQIVFIFIFCWLFFQDYFIALFSAFGMAFLPTPVFFATSLGLDSYFLTFALLAVVATCWYAKHPDVKSGILLISSIFLLLCVRLEAFLFLPIFGLIFISLRNENKKPGNFRIKLNRLDFIFGFILLISISVRALASISVIGKQWCCAEALPLEAFYPSYFIRNLLPNIFNLFNRREFPFFISLLALISLVKMENRKILLLAIWLVVFFIVYSSYYAGMFFTLEFSGSYGRFFLILIPPLLILSGMSLKEVVQKKKWPYRLLLILIFLTLIPTIIKYRSMISTSAYFNLVEIVPVVNHDFLANYIIPNTPSNSIIINNITAYTLMKDRSTTFLSTFLNDKTTQDFVVNSLKKGIPVYSLPPPPECKQFPQECETVNKLFDFKPVKLNKKYPYDLTFVKVELTK